MVLTELDDTYFGIFKDLIYRESGIKMNDMKRALVQARLTKRLRQLRLQRFEEYHDYLMDNFEEERIEFINAITTNKTDFFRENKHFEYMKEVCLPGFERAGKNEIRIWSAGCSTGEEPYSIAMTMLEYYEGRVRPDIKILATDIDTSVIEKADAGMYTLEQVEDIDLRLLKKYFYRGTGENEGLFKVKPQLRNLLTIRRLNLLGESYPMRRRFDLIFCRNVIIYFDRPTQQRLFTGMYDFLDDEGYLFIGHSENLGSITDLFSLVGNTIYRKNVMAAVKRG